MERQNWEDSISYVRSVFGSEIDSKIVIEFRTEEQSGKQNRFDVCLFARPWSTGKPDPKNWFL